MTRPITKEWENAREMSVPEWLLSLLKLCRRRWGWPDTYILYIYNYTPPI